MLNLAVLLGNLGDNPHVYFTNDGTAVTSFDIAFNSTKKKTCWIRVVTFNKLAEISAKLKKGNRIVISGVIDESKWTDKEGQNHKSFQILANSISFIKVDEGVFKDEEATPETTNDEPPF